MAVFKIIRRYHQHLPQYCRYAVIVEAKEFPDWTHAMKYYRETYLHDHKDGDEILIINRATCKVHILRVRVEVKTDVFTVDQL